MKMLFREMFQYLKSTCRYCGQQAGILRRDHRECQQTHQEGFAEMTQLAAQATSGHTFNQFTLWQALGAICQGFWATDRDIERALEEGFAQAR